MNEQNEANYRKWMGIMQQLGRETKALRLIIGSGTVTFKEGNDELLKLTKGEFADMSANKIVEMIRKNLGETK
jgi:hypothetical protein